MDSMNITDEAIAVIGIIVMFLVMRWVFKNGGCG